MKKQDGFGLISMLIGAAAIIAAIGYFVAHDVGVSRMFYSFSTAKSLLLQATAIRATVMSCAANAPNSDNTKALNKSFPAADAWTDVSALTCPSGGGLFASDTLSPVSPDGWGNWRYLNNQSTGVISLAITAPSDITPLNLVAKLAVDLGAMASTDTPDGTYGINSRLIWRIK